MGFDFFKKKDNKDKNGKNSGYADDLEFDDIDTSGEFLSGSEEAQPPAPAYQQPPPPPPAAAQPPSYQQPAPPPVTPPAVHHPPAGHPVDDDLTMINRPPVLPPSAAAPQAPVSPQAPGSGPVAPRPPGPPGPPGNPQPQYPTNGSPAVGPGAPPPAPPVSPPPSTMPPGLAPDEVTQVLNKPVSIEAMVAWLVITAGTMRGEDFRLPGGTARLGLHPDCEICITGDTFVSSQHAEIRYQGGSYLLQDLNSTNGLFVNGSRVSQAVLEDGDQVKAGTTLMVFKCVQL